MESHAIAKFINYRTASVERARRLSSYIKQLTRTEPEYVLSQYISKANSEHSLRIVEGRWHPMGDRSFKQGVLSFGATCEELQPTKALGITKEILEYFADFPWLAAIHTNKPEHIHTHFLLSTTNVRTGRKYSQSPQELRQFREHYNEVASKNSLPLLKEKGEWGKSSSCGFAPEAGKYAVAMEGGDEVEEVVSWACSPPPAMPVSAVAFAPLESNPLEIFGERFRNDFASYFSLGYMNWKG